MGKSTPGSGSIGNARVKVGTTRDGAKHRRKLFVEAYLANGGNATQAAIAAGYSARTASQQGYDLLREPEVAAEIARRRAELEATTELTTELVLRSLVRVLAFDPRRLFNADGSFKDVGQLDEDTALALTAVEVDFAPRPDGGLVVGTKRIRWADRNAARDQAMKHLGLYTRGNEQAPAPPAFDMTVLPSDTVKDAFDRAVRLARGEPQAIRQESADSGVIND